MLMAGMSREQLITARQRIVLMRDDAKVVLALLQRDVGEMRQEIREIDQELGKRKDDAGNCSS